MLRYIASMILLFNLFASAAYGFEQEKVSVRYGRSMTLSVSSKGINRINFGNERIDKIVGDGSSYTAVVSESGQDLFLTSKVEAGSKVNISVQCLSGKVLDIAINVIEKKSPSLIEISFAGPSIDDETKELEAMLFAMRNKKIGKYYVQQASGSFAFPMNPQIQFKQLNSYRYGNFQGVTYLVTNKDAVNSTVLSLNSLAQLFANVATIALESEVLAPRQQSRAYLIFRGGRDV